MTPARLAVDRLFANLARHPDREAIVFRGRSWTFGELDRLSRRYAGGLAALGIGRGDRVAMFAESAPETIVAMLGHYRLGAIHVPINTRYLAEEAGHILKDSGAKAVVVRAGAPPRRCCVADRVRSHVSAPGPAASAGAHPRLARSCDR